MRTATASDPEIDVIAFLERARRGARMLRQAAASCWCCQGKGHTEKLFEAFLMTDDERMTVGNGKRATARRARRSRVEDYPRGAGMLRRDCSVCRPIRQVIEILEEET